MPKPCEKLYSRKDYQQGCGPARVRKEPGRSHWLTHHAVPDRTRSPVAVSEKREYFKYPPETIGDLALEVAKFGAWRPRANLQKPAIGGHFWHC